ncbi:hypothetical protein PQI07_25635 [Methylobacterium sp. 092160098-2]|uniref:hypothetical protein n=1 Tax=Methylobacterium sp. 092160098-2 TaxID=3025129 RepID=UPI002381BFA1|nr:hypothetical protein [Methylobacterium sp. 092160098-2]MDE4914057.1 hypothetical protein [Methylobacterium sp. 092160098-2]
MSIERIRVPIPHVAHVVPRGARNPRPICFRTETVVGIRTAAASDLVIAVVTGGETGGNRRREYLGYDGALWLPCVAGSGMPVDGATILGAIGEGVTFFAGMQNPFLLVGPDLRIRDLAQARSIDSMALRQIVEDDREDRIARAARVADDFLLVDDGRILRRSVGPFWRCGEGINPFIASPEWELPTMNATYFAITRDLEVAEFAASEWGMNISGDFLELREPGFVPDHDGQVAARAIVSFQVIQWLTQLSGGPSADDEDVLATLRAAGKLYGRDHSVLSKGLRDYQTCPGKPPVAAEDLVTAVEGVRAFFGGGFKHRNSAHRDAFEIVRNLFEKSYGPALGRWDVYERERLDVAEAAPDLPPADLGLRS